MKIRKKNKKSFCLFCNKEFFHYSWDTQVYCSKDCYYKKSKLKVNCAVCNEAIFVSPSLGKRNSNFYCSRNCYYNRYGGRKRLKRTTQFFDNLLNTSKCACGINKKYLLQVHHIDGNKKNNNLSNIEIVCACCHVKRHLKLLSSGEWVYHPKSLTPRNLLGQL